MEGLPIPNQPKLHERIDNLKVVALKSRVMDRLSDAIISFNAALSSLYEKGDLCATPAWHKLIGSSQQQGVVETDKVAEITEKIETFVAEKETEFGVN